MQTYELLYVLPGTLTEEEVKPIVAKVKEEIEKVGGVDIVQESSGKNRLAYPMKHIRYGFFEIAYFQAEPKKVPALQTKLSLMKELLRVTLNRFEKGHTRGLNLTIGTVTQENVLVSQDLRRESEARAAAAATAQTATVEKPAVENAKPEVKMEDIDKKLDEILDNNNIANI
jgi:small subunit ribosomal protein S6